MINRGIFQLCNPRLIRSLMTTVKQLKKSFIWSIPARIGTCVSHRQTRRRQNYGCVSFAVMHFCGHKQQIERLSHEQGARGLLTQWT